MTSHIKIPDIPPIVRLVGNGIQTIFEFPFPIFASEDLSVSINGALQNSGFSVTGPGETAGGSVIFDIPPLDGQMITLERRMPFERLTDFIEGGDFAATTINTELDFIVAGLQQLEQDQTTMLQFNPHESPLSNIIPDKHIRAGKVLGFDGDGQMIAVPLTGAMAEPSFTAAGTGAITRTTGDKLKEIISVKDFGAIGDGVADDTIAFQNALAASKSVFVPAGLYRISSTLVLETGSSLVGIGDGSEIRTTLPITLIHIAGSYNHLSNLKLSGGTVGLKFAGLSGPCVHSAIVDISIWQAQTGILLDGGYETSKPVYWNNFTRVLVAQPFVNGIHLKRSGAGDTPNANRFLQCRVYSLGATTSGHGVYVEEGSFNNSFTDFEANLNSTATACVRCGPGSNKTIFVNLYTESHGGVPNVRLDAGSIETAIYNLLSASDGASIWDFSGGQYTAYNAGYPYKNKFQKSICNDLTSTLQRYDTEYIDTTGTFTLDLSHSIHLVSSFSGALTINLPAASTASGAMMVIKKIDSSKNIITVSEDGGGAGPDGTSYFLGGENDFVMVMSNGAEWFVLSSNRSPGNTRFYDGTGIYDIDMAVDVYLLSSFSGALNARLPPANSKKAIGRQITIKKTDVSSNAVTVTVQGGAGPDQYNQPLTAQFQSITVVSDGGQWFVIARYP